MLCVVTLGAGCTVKVADLTCARCEEPDRPCGSGFRCIALRCQPADHDVACDGQGGGGGGAAGGQGGQGGGSIEPEDVNREMVAAIESGDWPLPLVEVLYIACRRALHIEEHLPEAPVTQWH